MTPIPTESAMLNALRTFLLASLPDGVEVIKGQANLVAEPTSPDFVVMTPNTRRRLGYNFDSWDETNPDPSVIDVQTSTQVLIQLDFHGETSTDNAQVIVGLFRDDYACQFFAPYGFQPDYCDDGQQMPFVNGEGQWEDRWVVNAMFDANMLISTPAQFANKVVITPIAIDVAYPVGS